MRRVGGTRQGVSRQNTGVQYQYISGIYEPRH